MQTRIESVEAQIERIKRQLLALGEMRPGSLSRQRRSRGGLYCQLSYRQGGKGHTEYVRAERVPVVERQLQAYRRCRELFEQWTALAIELCQLKAKAESGTAGKNGPRGE